MVKLKYWLPAVGWMMVIFFMSGRTGSELNKWFFFVPNLNWGHLVEYFILSLLVYYALVKTTRLRRIFLLTVLISTAYGVTDEFHQSFVPGRQPDIADLINDAIGSVMAMAVIKWRGRGHGVSKSRG